MRDRTNDIDQAIAEFKQAIDPLCREFQLEAEIAELVRREFSLPSLAAKIDRARKAHRPRRRLIRYYQLKKAMELAA